MITPFKTLHLTLRQNFSALLIIVFIVLSACDSNKNAVTPAIEQSLPVVEVTPVQPEQYIDTGDLKSLSNRGTIRLLAPRFDTAQALPRKGLPMHEYQALAERFVASLGLKSQWIYVDKFEQLTEQLNSGKGDIVVTNLSVTSAREEIVAFTATLAAVDEVLVMQQQREIKSLDKLAGMRVAIPKGTSYEETLARLQKKYPELIVEVKTGDYSDTQMLRLVESGEADATVIDSNIADFLLPEFPQLIKGPVIKKNRNIAWAIRKENPQLRRSLNEFLVAEHIQGGRNEQAHRDWPQIKAEKKLRILTLNNPASYFMWRGELMGFDYDLMKEFSRRNGLRLEVIVKDDIGDLVEALKQGEGDVIASSLTVTPEREAAGIIFSRYYLKIREQLIGLKNGQSVNAIEQLAGKRIAVNPQTVYFKRLQKIKNDEIPIEILSRPGVATETLINELADGDYDFTVADSHLVAIERSYRDDIQVHLDLVEDVDIAWGLRADQPELLSALNSYIKKEYRGLFYNVTFKKYFVDAKNIQKHKKYRVLADNALSPFDDKVKQRSEDYTLDWRLVTAQIYQESKFDPGAKSFAGALGLMQVMPRTAKQFGYENLHDPDIGIAAGMAYMDWLHGRFPGGLSLDERLYFILAAYNAGAGHVRDARVLAKQLGKDPNRWFGNVEEAMLLLSKPDYAKKARFGYVRGSEPVNYVRSIRDRYVGYLRAADVRSE